MSHFQVVNDDPKQDGWAVCFGYDLAGVSWGVITKNVHASEASAYTLGAQGDAEIVAAMLELYFTDPEFRGKVTAAVAGGRLEM